MESLAWNKKEKGNMIITFKASDGLSSEKDIRFIVNSSGIINENEWLQI